MKWEFSLSRVCVKYQRTTMENIFTGFLICLFVLSASACTSDDFTCSNGDCIPIYLKCDRRPDCIDGSDEFGCTAERYPELRSRSGSSPCKSDLHFKCDNLICIPKVQRCDKIRNCQDGSDERNCTSTCVGGFQCVADPSICLDSSVRCNGRPDCPDGSDEFDCGCRDDEFKCHNGTCLNISKRCNGVTDCGSGEDERNCPHLTEYHPPCSYDEFRCRDGQCVPQRAKCNRALECNDGSDEEDCYSGNNVDSVFGEDPTPGTCPPFDFPCSDGSCIPVTKQCDGFSDCPDNTDELNCTDNYSTVAPTSGSFDGFSTTSQMPDCLSGEFRCKNGFCISSKFRCDKVADCIDKSDEQNCPPAVVCRPDEFSCRNGRQCISQSLRCDEVAHCEDESDERECPRTTTQPPRVSCPYNRFACHDGLQCVPLAAQCNGNYDCRDYSDERNCNTGFSSDAIQLKVYPEDQVIKEGREVVIQCRDEGSVRSPVEWVREDGTPLPPGSRSNGGRLEMPNIQLRDSGVYVCRALGYSPFRSPTIQRKSYLTVEKYVDPTTQAPKTCSLNEATCANGECIPKVSVCNGNYDCSDGSDETRCSTYGCEPNEFRCANRRCIQKTWRCDGDDDCLDHSDERDCPTNPPGSPCSFTQFQCANRKQCIPKSFQCDNAVDCEDGSDEVGCSPVYIKVPPPPKVVLDIGATFIITCEALGVPTPLISWRLNWNHIPAKCNTTSVNGFGTLICPDIQESDQGAYSCEAINIKPVIATPDTILLVNRPTPIRYPCREGTFNEVAVSQRDCVNCFCFGITSDCQPSNLYVLTMLYPLQPFRLVNVHLSSDGSIFNVRRDQQSAFQPFLLTTGRNSFKISSSGLEPDVRQEIYPYFAFPDSYHGNQLKSYGGHLRYTVRYTAGDRELRVPEIILVGNGYTLTYSVPVDSLRTNTNFEVNAKLAPGFWHKWNEPRGPIVAQQAVASREEIMMVLSGIEDILIKTLYTDGSEGETYISDIKFESASSQDAGQGKAIYVEECRCPAGYTGLSCENCAPGFIRKEQGPWKGQCRRDDIGCPMGSYGDPARGIPCQECPCPLTTPSNQFTRKCVLGNDNQPTCECPPGYMGRRCEYCNRGYVGNPLIPGDYCRPSTPVCDSEGSLSTLPDSSGQCRCKELTMGLHCNRCKDNSFYLSGSNPRGCFACYCSGLSVRCTSSNWYRIQITSSFPRDAQDFQLVKYTEPNAPLTNLKINSNARELFFNEFSPTSQDVYYWALSSKYLGDKVASYGGNLTYTVRHVPVPGGQSSKNNAVDVEIVGNDGLHLLFYSQIPVEPNQAVSITAPLLEQYWQSSEGQRASREQIMKTLSNIRNIFLKATYTTNTREAGLRFVSLDVAEDRNSGQIRAHEVEQCFCPQGYTGSSCQLCDVGYTRSAGDRCEPCDCNGHSYDCDPYTGTCFNCQAFATGERCEQCLPGYEGDPSRGYPCEPRNVQPCDCDPAGISTCTENSQCVCKINVEGTRCDRCRPNTFDLSAAHTEGCLQCFCSSVGETCRSSTLYITPIPLLVYDDSHGITLTDRNRQQTIRNDFYTDVAHNEISYDYAALRGQKLYWSLPSQFTGNRITSYGGNLTWTQRFTAGSDAIEFDDTDVVIYGNGIALFWDNKEKLAANTPKSYSVPLTERGWRGISPNVHDATRSELLTVLSSVESILIRASHASNTQRIYLSDVSLDSTVNERTSQGRATQVEMCQCPPGYKGTSCETCAEGHYRSDDKSCQRCPCNNNEVSCEMAANKSIVCNCLPGYSGSRCHSIAGIMMELRPQHVDQVVGSVIRFSCKYNSREPLSIEFETMFSGYRTPDAEINPPQESYRHYQWGSERFWNVTILDGLLLVTCRVRNADGVIIGRLTTVIGKGSSVTTTTPAVTYQPPRPSIQVSVREPAIQIIAVGGTVRFYCDARTVSARPVNVRWTKEGAGRSLPPHVVDDGLGILIIRGASYSDSGVYVCTATDNFNIVTSRATLTVSNGPVTERPRAVAYPRTLEVRVGEPAEFRCDVSGVPTPSVEWIKSSRTPGFNFRSENGLFRIDRVQPSDEGVYYCRAINELGAEDSQAVQLTVRRTVDAGTQTDVSLAIDPPEYTGPGGRQVILKCSAPYTPTTDKTIIKWSRKETGSLPVEALDTDGILTISNPNIGDSGIYICTAETLGGSIIGSRESQVNIATNSGGQPPSPPPNYPSYYGVQVNPRNQTVPEGSTVTIECRTNDPSATINWAKHNEDRLPPYMIVNGETLVINSISKRDEGTYICSIQNPGGNVFQDYAMVEVTTAEESYGGIAPRVRLYPNDTIVSYVGDSAFIQCLVEAGDPPPVQTWTRPDHDGQFGPHVKIEPDRGLLRINNVSLEDAGKYTCVAENSVGREFVQAYLQVQSYPVVTIHPTEDRKFVRVGDSLILDCTAYGVPTPTVYWAKYIEPYDRNLNKEELVENAVYRIASVRLSDAGVYVCIGKNAAGSDEKRLQVIVESRGEYPTQTARPGGDIPSGLDAEDVDEPERGEFVYAVGTTAHLRCDTVNTGNGIVEWTKNGQYISNNPNIQIQNEILWFNPVEPGDSGEYACILKNENNDIMARSRNTVIVREPPRITLHPPKQTVKPNDEAYIRCSAVGSTPISIRWQSARGSFPSHIVEVNGELRFNGIKIEDEGKYTCFANNSVGSADATAEVIVTALGGDNTQAIRADKEEVTIHEGDTTELRCNTFYALDMNSFIKWSRVEGLPMQRNVEGKVLRIISARASDSGKYKCSVYSQGNIIGSAVVRLNVRKRTSRTPELKIERSSPTQNQPIMQGSSVDLECQPSEDVKVTWSKLGSPLAANVMTLRGGRMLRVSDVRLENSGYYECAAIIGGINISSQYNLVIENYLNDAPIFDAVSTKEAPYGSKITLTCNNDLAGHVEYTWSKRSNGHVLPLGAFSRENTLTLIELKNSDAGMYVCKVSSKDLTVEIPTILLVTDSVPSFSQKPVSYLALPTLTDAHLHFSIEISFKPTDDNGIILYTGESSAGAYKGKGDFISFGLEDGYPLFKFDVGSGAAAIKSNFSLELNEWHTVTLKRNRRKGMMFVDTMGPFTGESQGVFQGLDLSEMLFIGGVPDFGEIHPSAGFSRGFKGCISRLKYNRTEFELFKMATEKVGVDSCNTCKSSKNNACINNGLCQDAATRNGYTCICPPGFSGERCAVLGEPCYPGACGDGSCQDVDGTMQCLCPIGTTGKRCEQKIKIIQPAFKHGSYLAYRTPKTMRKFKVSLRLNPRDVRDGIILYSGQSDDGLGDFISLAIKEKHMEFRFDTGSGLVSLRSKVMLIPHEWVVVTIIKDGREGKLSVAGEPLIVGKQQGEKLTNLNLRGPLYIGGYNIYHVTPSPRVEVTEGFHGCISAVDVLGSEMDLINSAVDSANIMDCSDMEFSTLCSKKPCLNYGMCYPTDTGRGFNCSCVSGYTGSRCEIETNACMSDNVCRNSGVCKVTADSYDCLCQLGYAPPNCAKKISLGSEIQLLGDGYVELKRDLIEEKRSEESYAFDFVTDKKNGLLLWHGQPSYKNGLSRNFVAVAVVNGYLEYSFDLGDGVVTIKYSKDSVTDGIKHSVNVTREGKFGTLRVDEVVVGKGESPGTQEVIRTPGHIYLGGTPNMELMTGGRYTHPISGLLMNIHVQNNLISSISNSASSGLHVMPWIRKQGEE